ncbi:NAD(P)/FAD-dependent oxidoreductase [Planococcus lenghuensis]|uniref:Pyridine nucleotide-disulfide oxidoreductase n=1 Tax=Planococcus lenghuensis TaxID=2213202 RepID=A0A1Q2KUJ3_9BACL|nr:NAD(P)/FAD-dependent oxidoreductase [Planococcus lenghuensis]AQQ51880.1 pyridine nucleotide-disulfide oxidoreductase [Planococcus lenghuensis]
MIYDCAIIGGGPAGLNAALVLGRSRRNVVLFDGDNGRNLVTREAHGFLTRDGIKPEELKRIASEEIDKYDSVNQVKKRVAAIKRISDTDYELITEDGEVFHSIKLLLATGLQEELPDVPKIWDFYGKSLYSCPYCDGWEVRDQPLAVIADKSVFTVAKKLYTWSRDIVICTNGEGDISEEDRTRLAEKEIRIIEQPIADLQGADGQLEKIVFADGTSIDRRYGFITPYMKPASNFGEQLGCEVNAHGGIVTDKYRRTSVWNIYAAGDASHIVPSQLIIAAGEGSAAALGIDGDLTNEYFDNE